MIDHISTHKPKLTPVTITLNGIEYLLDEKNIKILKDDPNNLIIYLFSEAYLIDIENAWSNDDIRNEFAKMHNYKNLDIEFDDLDENIADEFNVFINMKQDLNLNIEFKSYIASKFIKIVGLTYEVKVTGTIIKDRKTAFNIFKLLKEFGSIKSGNIRLAIDALTVNDLYNN